MTGISGNRFLAVIVRHQLNYPALVSPPATTTTPSSFIMDIQARFEEIRRMPVDHQKLGLSDWSNIEPLFDKAINTPTEITPHEKHQIAQWPPHEEMEAQCQKQFNRSISDLLQAAVIDRDSLTCSEATLIRQGFHDIDRLAYTERQAVARRRRRFEQLLWDKYQQALGSVLLPVEIKAWNAVTDDEWFNEKLRTSLQHTRNPFVDSGPAPWVQKIIDQGDSKPWGYIIYCFRLNTRWQNFQSKFNDRVFLAPSVGVGSDQIRRTKLTEFLNFDGPEDDLVLLRQ